MRRENHNCVQIVTFFPNCIGHLEKIIKEEAKILKELAEMPKVVIYRYLILNSVTKENILIILSRIVITLSPRAEL